MLFDLEDNLLILLSCVARHIRAYGDELALSLGITRSQLIVLARLEQAAGHFADRACGDGRGHSNNNRALDRSSGSAWHGRALPRSGGPTNSAATTDAGSRAAAGRNQQFVGHAARRRDRGDRSRRPESDGCWSGPHESKPHQSASKRTEPRRAARAP